MTSDIKLEAVPVPVSDVDRAKAFYTEQLGFGLDVDHRAGDQFLLLGQRRQLRRVVVELGGHQAVAFGQHRPHQPGHSRRLFSRSRSAVDCARISAVMTKWPPNSLR